MILIPIKITAKIPFYFSHPPNLGTGVCNPKIQRLFVFSGAHDGQCGGSRACISHPCVRGIRLSTIPCFLLQILHCLVWKNKSVLMWYAVMSFCCAAGSRGSGTAVSVLQGWWKSAQSKLSHGWQLCLKACRGLGPRNKEKALPCYLLYFHRGRVIALSCALSELECLAILGGICYIFIGCEEFNLFFSSCCFNWVMWSYENPLIYFLNALISTSGWPHSCRNCCLPPRKTLLKSL